LPYPNSSATLLDMTDKPYCFSQDYELAVTVSSISGSKDLMRMAYGTKEPRHVIEQAMKETALEGGIWEDAITFYPVSAIIGYRLVEMDGLSKATGCGSGATPGHIGICACPGDGCHTAFCALRLPNAAITQRAKIKGRIAISPRGRIEQLGNFEVELAETRFCGNHGIISGLPFIDQRTEASANGKWGLGQARWATMFV
jgi:hypothetical protein